MRVVYDKLGKRTGAPPFLRLPELWKERVERMENAKKKSRKKKVLIWVLIVLLALAGGGWYAMKRMNDAMQTAASAQNTYTVTRGNVSVTITGSGSGHNLGMSQYGAKAMAELGYTYDEILEFYYTDITIK